MKILVTGGAGFIGSTIADGLVQLGHTVVVVDNMSSGKPENINTQCKLYKVDIVEKDLVESIIKSEKPEIIIHLAAQIDVRKSVEDPAFDARVNVIGTINVLESARKNNVRKVIFASSGGTIYGECGAIAPDETFSGNPLSPYGITKFTVEHYLHYYKAVHGLAFTILRYGNVYGPRQDPHGEAGVVAIFAGKLLKGEPVTIFGDGKQMRDYVFVKDVMRANIAALTMGDNQVINISTQITTSVNELFAIMSSITGYTQQAQYKPARAGELFKSVLNIEKAKKILHWDPTVSIREGLVNTIEYFKGDQR